MSVKLRLAGLFLLLSATSIFTLPSHFVTLSASPPQISCSIVPPVTCYSPGFVVLGDTVKFNLTGRVTGGTPPFSFAWNFGDGQTGAGVLVYHLYGSVGTYSVRVNVTDSASQTNSISYPVVVQTWPVAYAGWVIRWNITANDGINIWNVTYHGLPVINDVRLAGVQAIYRNNFCGPFYDEPFNETGVKLDGDIFYENSMNILNPYFQIRGEYRVGGYYYMETFRFYPSGRWDTELTIARGGCAFDHIYEPHWRFNLALGGDPHNFMSFYTPTGAWQDLLWEGNYTDNEFRDPAHNGAQWRIGDQGIYYYITPTIVRADLDLPYLPSNLLLVQQHPNEIELSHPELGIENPIEFVNGELAFRQNIAFWFIPQIWDHGPVSIAPPKDITLSFYPYGLWP